MAGEGTTLEYTPTWVVALVLKKNDQKPLFEALQKIKEELMLLGFISLLLTVFQNSIAKFCISEDLASKWLPCKKDRSPNTITTTHFDRLLAESSASADYCTANGKVPLLSSTALHHLHIFIFVLAVVHVTFCALTILFGGAKIRKWKRWEDSASKGEYDLQEGQSSRYTHVQDHDFIKHRFQGLGKSYSLLGWLHSFFKQFYGSVTKSDYTTLRLGFIMTHCRGNPKFNFHKYMMRTLEADFKKVVGISWYLWLFVCLFLLLNVYGWHTYFWIAFIPFVLLLAVGTKLEHIINQLAHEVAEKHVAVEGDLVVQPSDDHFWFQRPKIIILLIHIILFQNSFELAFFFWIWGVYSVPLQLQYPATLCYCHTSKTSLHKTSSSCFSVLKTAIVEMKMGTSFKKAIFDEHIQDGLVGWARMAKRNKTKNAANGSSHKQDSAAVIQLVKVAEKQLEIEEDK
ncbi:hypothetical protein Q3G72_003763 [Acer saccharum]|nr:hypothetical protein Q3G72_003763 [Acer saccharum]